MSITGTVAVTLDSVTSSGNGIGGSWPVDLSYTADAFTSMTADVVVSFTADYNSLELTADL